MNKKRVLARYSMNIDAMDLVIDTEDAIKGCEEAVKNALANLFISFSHAIRHGEDLELLESGEYTVEISAEQDKWDARFLLELWRENVE